MRAILQARLRAAGGSRWKSGTAAALQHAERFAAEKAPRRALAAEEVGGSVPAENVQVHAGLVPQAAAAVMHRSRTDTTDTTDADLLVAMGGLVLEDTAAAAAAAADVDVSVGDEEEDGGDLGMGTSRGNTLRENQRAVTFESEEDEDDDGDDDMGRRKTSGTSKRVVLFESEEDEEEEKEEDDDDDDDDDGDGDREEKEQNRTEVELEHLKTPGELEEPEDTNPLIDLTQLLCGDSDDADDADANDSHKLPIVLDDEKMMDHSRRRRHRRRRRRPANSASTTKTPATPTQWKNRRAPLAASLYQEFNTNVFRNKLPADLSITWNARLLRTAGLTHMRAMGEKRMARIDLASKVLTDEHRLRSTLLHELCHVAAWLIDGVRKPPHGPGFKKWGRRCTRAYPGITVKTCHSYEIQYKFTYLCEHHPACGWKVGRHSKSIDTEKMCCGRCRGAIVLQPQLEADGVTPKKVRKPSTYAVFNKQQHALLKDSDMTFGQKVTLISERWARLKGEANHNKEN